MCHPVPGVNLIYPA